MPIDVKSLSDPVLVRNLLSNAKRLGNLPLVLECQVRLGQIEGAKYSSPLEREFWTAVRAVEEIKSAEKGKTIRLNRTRQKVDRVGVLQCLVDWAVSPNVTDGFKTLVEGGKADLTGEAIVVRHNKEFASAVVETARAKLQKNGVDPASIAGMKE